MITKSLLLQNVICNSILKHEIVIVSIIKLIVNLQTKFLVLNDLIFYFISLYLL